MNPPQTKKNPKNNKPVNKPVNKQTKPKPQTQTRRKPKQKNKKTNNKTQDDSNNKTMLSDFKPLTWLRFKFYISPKDLLCSCHIHMPEVYCIDWMSTAFSS